MHNELFYYFKPYIIFALGFICGTLDHPIKWVSVVMLIWASLLIEWWRYKNRAVTHIYLEGN